MRIVVLVKPVPDPASAGERLGPDGRLDRAAVPAVVNGNDEYALEAALKLVEAGGGEVTLLSMAPQNAPETLRKALAMGATRGVHVTDPTLAGSCAVSTARVLAAALRDLEFDLVLAGVDTSDGVGGVVPAAIAAHLGLPYLSTAARIEPDEAAGTVRVRRISPTGYDLLEAPMPAVIACTQALGEPRYPSLKGIMAARAKEITHAIARGPWPGPGRGRWRGSHDGRPRDRDAAGAGRYRGRPRERRGGRGEDRRVPRSAPARLMGTIWIVAEAGPDGGLARISAEAATLARELGSAAGRDVVGIVVGAEPEAVAQELAGYVPVVWSVADPSAGDHAWSAVAARHIAAILGATGDGSAVGEAPDAILVGAGPDGRDLAGALSALTGLGVLVNATGVTWADSGPAVEMSVFGGKLITTSGFTAGRGIITVRPNVVTAVAAESAGRVEPAPAPATATADATTATLPAVRVVDRVSEAGAAAPIEEARIIVSGGRGMGGADGFQLVRDLASALDGAVGATRAAVDSGWIPYSQQIGQTGKIVKPELYLALGISGAIQHKVGMQTAGAIVAVNRDPDAPIAEFADLMIVGDLFEVGAALLEQLRARSG